MIKMIRSIVVTHFFFFFLFGKYADEGFLNPTRSLEALPGKTKKFEKMSDEDYKEMDEKVVNSIHLNVSK